MIQVTAAGAVDREFVYIARFFFGFGRNPPTKSAPLGASDPKVLSCLVSFRALHDAKCADDFALVSAFDVEALWQPIWSAAACPRHTAPPHLRIESKLSRTRPDCPVGPQHGGSKARKHRACASNQGAQGHARFARLGSKSRSHRACALNQSSQGHARLARLTRTRGVQSSQAPRLRIKPSLPEHSA